MYNSVIIRSQFGDPLNSVFGWVNLKSHLTIPFNHNLKIFFLMAGFEPLFLFENFLMVGFFSLFF
jgi:hypothetical protein